MYTEYDYEQKPMVSGMSLYSMSLETCKWKKKYHTTSSSSTMFICPYPQARCRALRAWYLVFLLGSTALSSKTCLTVPKSPFWAASKRKLPLCELASLVALPESALCSSSSSTLKSFGKSKETSSLLSHSDWSGGGVPGKECADLLFGLGFFGVSLFANVLWVWAVGVMQTQEK